MKRFRTACAAAIIGLIGVVGVRPAGAVVTTIFNDNFDEYAYSASTATVDTELNTQYNNIGTNQFFALSKTGGIGGSQAVYVTQGDNAGFRFGSSQGFNLSAATGSSATLSVEFQYQPPTSSSGSNAIPQIGFSSNAINSFVSNTDISGRLTGPTGPGSVALQLRNNNAVATGVTGNTGALTLTAGNWYALVFTATGTATASNFAATLTLYNANGTTGLIDTSVAGTVASISGTLVSSTAYAAQTNLLAGFRLTGTVPVNVDNFTGSGTLTPEPGTLSVAGMIGAGMLLRRRRASAEAAV